MTKTQIKAELRRSAFKAHPWYSCNEEAYKVAFSFVRKSELRKDWTFEIDRTFFLLVAEAL